MIARFFFVLSLLVGSQAWAQIAPACLPKQMGGTVGSAYLQGSVDGFVWEPDYVRVEPDVSGMTSLNQVARAYYAANVTTCTSLGCGTARLAMRAALLP